MTTFTDHGLACLGDGDYAAVALAMQVTAQATDAALDSVSDALDTYPLRPWMTASTTAISGPNSTSGESVFNIGSWSLASGVTIPSSTVGVASGIRLTIARTGWYEYGGFHNQQATGAVTANSRRTVFASATRRDVGSSTVLDAVRWRTVDTNTGGEFLIACSGSFYATAGQIVDVEMQWSHANAASTVQVNAGARLWCFFAGSGVEIGSA